MDPPILTVIVAKIAVIIPIKAVLRLATSLNPNASRMPLARGVNTRNVKPPVTQATAAAFSGPRTPSPFLQKRNKP
jgi:hypothetical protein